MNEDSIKLLKECNAGCKSAVNSLRQVREYVIDSNLINSMDKSCEKHEHLGDKLHKILNEHGESEKDPETISKAFAGMMTEIKLLMNNDTHRIAKMLVDGCNMGIKSLSDYIMKYPDADSKIVEYANELIDIEVDLIKELEAF